MSSKSKEIKHSWNQLKSARELLRVGEISMKSFDEYFDRFHADAEPLIENLEDDDSE
jgi:hypothetical protein